MPTNTPTRSQKPPLVNSYMSFTTNMTDPLGLEGQCSADKEKKDAEDRLQDQLKKAPPGSTGTVNPDNSITIVYPDGSRQTEFPDKSGFITYSKAAGGQTVGFDANNQETYRFDNDGVNGKPTAGPGCQAPSNSGGDFSAPSKDPVVFVNV